MATFYSSLFVVMVVLAGLAASVQEDANYDVSVRVVKPKKLNNLISSFSRTTLCKHPPSGLGRMIRGIDAAYLDLLPLQTNTDMGFRRPIFDYTCNEGKKVFLNDKEYDLPDQIDGAEPVPGGLKSTKVEVFKEMRQVIDSLKLSVGIGDALGVFMLSASFNYAHSTLTNTSRYLEEVSAHVSSFRADHAPSWVMDLTKYAQMYLDRRLTGPFTRMPERYREFIENFGTHYFQEAIFGGMLKLVVETESAYFETTTTTGVGLQAQGLFGKIVKLKGGIGVGNSDVDSSFESSSKSLMRYWGGFTNLLDQGDMKDWMPTVMENPWLFKGNLMPIYDLIVDDTKKKEMKLAVQVHLDKAYLTYLRKLIETVVAKEGANSDTYKWMDMVTTEAAKMIPDHARLRSMGKDIEFHLAMPDWFKKYVHVCFEWAPTTGTLHNPKQCNQGSRPRKLCAKLGEFTLDYLDDTDMSFGGCFYRWGLEIVGNPGVEIPNYFRNTVICHKWHAEADAGQCDNGRTNGVNCAKVGQMTRQYLDDTNFRTGGCEYSWMIGTTWDAPMWLKNLQLCFKWRATGDRQQCGNNGVPNLICTKSDTWSTPYNDDSSQRGGGCMMSWGLKNGD